MIVFSNVLDKGTVSASSESLTLLPINQPVQGEASTQMTTGLLLERRRLTTRKKKIHEELISSKDNTTTPPTYLVE
jgi:hypothetical protein